MNKKTDNLISPDEIAKLLGLGNGETIREGIRNGTFPFGMAFRSNAGRWTYYVPRKPIEEFAKTGKLPPKEY